VIGTLTVNGTISANGGNGGSSQYGGGPGGGSGGSIWLIAGTLAGNGTIRANGGGGGSPSGGGGAGGRLGLVYTNSNYSGTKTVSGAGSGGVGTVNLGVDLMLQGVRMEGVKLNPLQ
jgi:hypothetical protein